LVLLISRGFWPSSLNIFLIGKYLEGVYVPCDQFYDVSKDDFGLEVRLEKQVVNVVVEPD
jgi:hypothetical protein